ncbi:trypsin-2 isoform X1 [Colletes latitarsis]|uniref:trypsin-2 isoform X1 n=1 Tax=Colletes latitarsis TaxID=2605962 RepID=UPI0040366351
MLLLPFAIVLAVQLWSCGLVYTSTEQSPSMQVDWEYYSLTGRIVNGTKAVLRQFPYQVSLRRSYNSRHFCGGSLIDEYYVLTAAHCMYMNGGRILPWTITVVAGELQLSKETATGQSRGVDEIFVHSEFDETTLQNDIALLVLKVPFKLTQEVMPVQLATNEVEPGTICQVSGWGYPAFDIPIVTNDLMYVDLPIISRNKCKELLVNVTNMPPGMFCAGYIEGLRDACLGDSGGGMICNGVLSGVVSGGEECALPGFPGVYSDVFFYESWILEKMNVVTNRMTSKDVETTNDPSELPVTPKVVETKNDSSGAQNLLASALLLLVSYSLISI